MRNILHNLIDVNLILKSPFRGIDESAESVLIPLKLNLPSFIVFLF